MKTITLSTRLTEKEARELDSFAMVEGMERSSFIKQLLRQGLDAFKFNRAVSLYRAKKISLSKAAEISNMTIQDLLLRFSEQSLELNYDIDELERDLDG